MKRILITLFVLFAASHAMSQFGAQIGAGYSTIKKATAELALLYDFGSVLIQAGYIQHLTRDVSAGTIINAKVGHRFYSGNYFIEPMAGQAFAFRSSDHEELNTKSFIASVTAGKVINDGSLYVSANYFENNVIASVGIRYNF